MDIWRMLMSKFFLITVDTEGDNLWTWKQGDTIHTKNTLYLQRFQDLCNKYEFKPVWLTNYEMIQDDRYVDFITKIEHNGQGELGMHLHAWSSPPSYALNVTQDGAPYLIEYPTNIMEEKIAYLTDTITKRTGIKAISHRAGRWAMDERYFQLLCKYGYKVDCSITPGINWKSSIGATEGAAGSDYSKSIKEAHWIDTSEGRILEVPLTVWGTHRFAFTSNPSLKRELKNIYHAMKGQQIALRPNGNNLGYLKALIRYYKKSDSNYLMFMIHSSELMPGGSPTFKDAKSIEQLYKDLEVLFRNIARDYKGITLRDYYQLKGEEELL